MAKRTKFDENGDSGDLQALFDSIAAQPSRPRLEVVSEPEASGDTDELQALFDSVAEGCVRGDPEPPPSGRSPPPVHLVVAGGDQVADADARIRTDVFNRVGHMARELHDMLHDLGYERVLQDTVRTIPDTRQRLAYIAEMTEQAARRALNATDIAMPIQERIAGDARDLSGRWTELYARRSSIDEFKKLASDTHGFLGRVPEDARAIGAQLTEIMMAQDFQDLTGQVIKKMLDISQRLEDQLLHLLVEVTPEDKREDAESLLNGPAIGAAGCGDVLADQAQVDELLESLGF